MKVILSLFLSFFLFISCGSIQKAPQPEASKSSGTYDYVIAFGSCNRQDEAQPLWDAIIEETPDLFLWGGDNIYADTDDMAQLEADYHTQKNQPDYKKLLVTTPVMGTWDDHDYGNNDAGEEWEYKNESQQLFLDFFDVPKDDDRRKREGVYHSRTIEEAGKSLKIIVLDTRYFRTKLEPGTQPGQRYKINDKGTVLGAEQWKWLENELSNSKSDYNLILSSIQVLSAEHGFETWGNFPSEVERLEKLLGNSGAKNVIILSGDRHISEFSEKDVDGLDYKLVDFTSSGMTHSYAGFSGEPNKYRVGEVVSDLSFGILKFDFETGKVRMEMRGPGNILQQEYTVHYRD
ncbi:alkaline phosphatase family protein [Antarcticibacterium flavum]|uniref:Alkaline phosphatase family protein n=1 Tax=Antarcticibacterium flavum TaxID=2058175 RepID=A0A5B7X678_9FLAO|nr:MULTISPECIES: alkaline phosphatase D family protein [Antarcticibacterium]MCM4159327.1 alkaline phosphatase [Antarcticibacterium sp. W02-3]QCY70966.1 alkaline phosphatase family protein [Antarcticibacterium flavum]